MSTVAAKIDATIDIVTPENITFTYRVAGPFRRFPAYLIDLAIIIALHFAVMRILSLFAMIVWLQGVAIVAGAILFLIIWWFYGGLFETFMNGQTPGKWMLGLRVLTLDGKPINGMQAVIRNILRLADMMPLASIQIFDPIWEALVGQALPPVYAIPTFLVGLTVMTFSRRFQRLGDLVCGTMVVIEERHWLTGVAKLEDPRAPQLAAYLPADFRVSRSLAKTLATYVERRRFFSTPRRREVARFLAEPLLRKFGLPADTSYDLLLCALYYRTFIAERGDDKRKQRNDSPFETLYFSAD